MRKNDSPDLPRQPARDQKTAAEGLLRVHVDHDPYIAECFLGRQHCHGIADGVFCSRERDALGEFDVEVLDKIIVDPGM